VRVFTVPQLFPGGSGQFTQGPDTGFGPIKVLYSLLPFPPPFDREEWTDPKYVILCSILFFGKADIWDSDKVGPDLPYRRP
jgi:hypothetical protein